MKKKYAALFVSGALLISNAGLLKAESFEGRESEMNAKCAVIKDTKTQEECSRYKDYLQSKSDNLDKEISDIKSQIASVKGDVEKACYDKASAYTPNPGGVGPMTRAMLLANVVEMAERHA